MQSAAENFMDRLSADDYRLVEANAQDGADLTDTAYRIIRDWDVGHQLAAVMRYGELTRIGEEAINDAVCNLARRLLGSALADLYTDEFFCMPSDMDTTRVNGRCAWLVAKEIHEELEELAWEMFAGDCDYAYDSWHDDHL